MAITFGKRKPLTAREAFGNEGIALAKELGLKIDGPTGLFPSESGYKELMSQERANLDRRTAKVNKSLLPLVGSQCNMVPYFLVPESCWFSDTGPYLLECLRLTPYAAWNTAFLPGNPFTAAITGMPLHPGAEFPGHTAHIKTMIVACQRGSAAATEKVRSTGKLDCLTIVRNQELAIILNAARVVASQLAEMNKLVGPLQKFCLEALERELKSG